MLKAVVRRVVPAPLRARFRQSIFDLPSRVRDIGPDLREAIWPATPPVPPARLRIRVGRTSSRSEFLGIGAACAHDVRKAFDAARDPTVDYPRWLDFGCGCARVARHLVGAPGVQALDGFDTDPTQVAWNAKHLPGRWRSGPASPPLPFPDAGYDVVFSVSVFTHLDEAQQDAWLSELRRVLAPGGLLIASTHSPALVDDAFSVAAQQRQLLADTGFLHVGSAGPFNHQATFHSAEYLQTVWSRLFEPLLHVPLGLGGYQDVSVWRRLPSAQP